MAKILIRSDEAGIFILFNGERFRPGGVTGLDHAYRMDGGDLAEGDLVNAGFSVGTGQPICRIQLASGSLLVWATEEALALEATREPREPMEAEPAGPRP